MRGKIYFFFRGIKNLMETKFVNISEKQNLRKSGRNNIQKKGQNPLENLSK